MSSKICFLSASLAICTLFLMPGCGPAAEPGAPAGIVPEPGAHGTLALRFAPQESATYKTTTRTEMSLGFEGAFTEKPEFTNRRNYINIELIFAQQIQSVDDQGNALAKVTIKQLKYLSIFKNEKQLDFDSSREGDQNSPLAKLVGQSYTVKITPNGEVSDITDIEQARAAIVGSSLSHKNALSLLSEEHIKHRHSVPALGPTAEQRLKTGDDWNNTKVFTFPIVGAQSYERVYTFKEIIEQDNQQVAVVEMNAIPSAEMAADLHKKDTTRGIARMFDNTTVYTGQLEFELAKGKVKNYSEKLVSEWIIVNPAANRRGNEEPTALKMGAIRSYSLEEIH